MHLPLHFHHAHDIAGCTDGHHDWPDWAVALLTTLDRRELQLMTALQDQIDAATQQYATIAADFTALVPQLQDALDAANNAEPTADLSGLSDAASQLQSALSAIQALVPAPVVDPQPVVDPAPADNSGDQPAQPTVPLA